MQSVDAKLHDALDEVNRLRGLLEAAGIGPPVTLNGMPALPSGRGEGDRGQISDRGRNKGPHAAAATPPPPPASAPTEADGAGMTVPASAGTTKPARQFEQFHQVLVGSCAISETLRTSPVCACLGSSSKWQTFFDLSRPNSRLLVYLD